MTDERMRDEARQTQTDTHTDRQTSTQTNKHTDRHNEIQADSEEQSGEGRGISYMLSCVQTLRVKRPVLMRTSMKIDCYFRFRLPAPPPTICRNRFPNDIHVEQPTDRLALMT